LSELFDASQQLSAHVHGSFSVCVIPSTCCGEIPRLETGRDLIASASLATKIGTVQSRRWRFLM